jgi:HAD superfamily hydrolase (TIGR01509 family)
VSRFGAIIFDMDGVLVDSEPLDFKACNILLEQEGVPPITEEENRTHLLGTTVDETWRRLMGLRRLPRPLAYYTERYDPIVRELLQEDLGPQPGVLRLLEALRQRKMKAAVASSSLRAWVDLKLSILGLQEAFDLVLGGDEVGRGKPEPDIYLLATQGLGLPPKECIAIEDSPVGIAAAVAAGTYTVAVRTSFTQGMDVSQAHLILDSLESFDLALLA